MTNKRHSGNFLLGMALFLVAPYTCHGISSLRWQFNLETTGNDFFWTSPTAIDDGSEFQYTYSVTKVEVRIRYYFLNFWYDVTDRVLADQKIGSGTQPGPLPLDASFESLRYPETEPYSLAVDLRLYADRNGYGHTDLTNVQMGRIDYEGMDLYLTGLRLSGYLDITAMPFPTPTPIPPEPTAVPTPTPGMDPVVNPTPTPEPSGTLPTVTPTPIPIPTPTLTPAPTPTPESTPVPEDWFRLTMRVIGGNGSLVAVPHEYFRPGSVILVQAVPDPGYQVKQWSGTDRDSSLETENTVTMNADTEVTVEFAPVNEPVPANTEPADPGFGCGLFGVTLISVLGLMALRVQPTA